MDINKTLANEFSLRQEQVDNTVALIDDDKTIPFIARYRKELTGSLDDQILRELYDRLMYLRNLEKRKEEIRTAITDQEKMTPEIENAISAASTLVEIEDIYRPFKPKRRTRASIAREKGLEPLAELIMEQSDAVSPEEAAADFVSEEKEIADEKAAIQGAMDTQETPRRSFRKGRDNFKGFRLRSRKRLHKLLRLFRTRIENCKSSYSCP